MASVNKDFVVKNGLQVGGLTTLAPAGTAGSIAFPSTGSNASSPSAGQLWRNGNDLKIYLGSIVGTKTIAYTDSTITGTWNGGVIDPLYGGTGVSNASTSTITLGGALEFSGAHTAKFTLTNNTELTLPTTGTVATTLNTLGDFASTTSSALAGVISDETGSGNLVFATSPTFDTSIDGSSTFSAFGSSTALTIGGTSAAQTLTIGGASTNNSTYSFGTGATATGKTKTVSIGTGGVSGSTTNIYIGSASGTSTTTVNQNLIVSGNLTVEGTTTTIDSTTLAVTDKNIEMAVPVSPGVPSDTNANGGGIIVKGTTDHSLLWYNGSPRQYWQFNSGLDLVSGSTYSINGSEVLSNSAVTIAGAKVSASTSAVAVTSASPTVVASFNNSYRAAKLIVTLEQGGDFMVTELLIVHNDFNAYITEYGRIQTGSVINATIDADMGVSTVDISVVSTSASGGSPLNVRYTCTSLY